MRTTPFAALAMLLVGCGDRGPSCEETARSLEAHLAGRGLHVQLDAARCTDDGYSASLRRCLSNARDQAALERCATESVARCLSSAGDQAAVDRCVSHKKNLMDLIDDAAASARLDRARALAEIGEYGHAFGYWSKAHPDKRCPSSLEELETAAVDHHLELALADPWGSPFTMRCDAAGFRVISFGPDKQRDTSDDLGGAL